MRSLFSKADQKSLKFWSLIRCQTSLNLASMTADSVTEGEVGIREAILRCCESSVRFAVFVVVFEFDGVDGGVMYCDYVRWTDRLLCA
jgi:hypothetical protein